MDEPLQQIQTKGSLLKNDQDFQTVVFSSKSSFKKLNVNKQVDLPNTASEFDIKKATKEIIKFGAKGFHNRRRDQTLKSLAIELGAKPEKRKYRNYKELKDIRVKTQQTREERLSMMEQSSAHHLRLRYSRKQSKNQTRKSNPDILKNYGKRKR